MSLGVLVRGALAGGLVTAGAVVLVLGLLLGLPLTGFITLPGGSPVWVLGGVAAFAVAVAAAGVIVLRPLRVAASRAVVAGLIGHIAALSSAAALSWIGLLHEPSIMLLAALAIGCALTMRLAGAGSSIKLALVVGGFVGLAAGLPFAPILLPDFVLWMIALCYAPLCWALISLVAFESDIRT